ncbi:MAG: branched-chain alpha-keto acid dehydrogenase subunit E2 [Proteobacteria bacterium]|nr:MAG: branched-chain alpha-keto acid dehydrogenase subunit E2 [Pseudomonadota bacterium]
MAATEVKLPDIGDFENVDVIELLVAPGDRVAAEQSLLVLESDKATMEIPSPVAGVVKKLLVGVGDKVSEGTPLALIEAEAEASAAASESPAPSAPKQKTPTQEPAPPAPGQPAPTEAPASAGVFAGARSEPQASEAHEARGGAGTQAVSSPATAAEAPAKPHPTEADLAPYSVQGPRPAAHAGPSVRRLARELGVDLALVPASGPKNRILAEDVQGYVKALIAQRGSAAVPIAGVRVAGPVEVDFSKWGPTESAPLNRVRLVAAANLHRSWVTVPHVTQFDEADVTELEAFRQQHKDEAARRGTKLTFLPFLVMAVVKALREFPHFNASLDHTGENLVVKRYFHVGVAVDTEHGLVVPVLRDADRKTLFEIAAELQDLSERARARRLRPEHLQGGTFSISSLGGIGGTRFTPIVNHPEVAILGVSKMEWKPVYRAGPEGHGPPGHQDGAFVPRRILPLSLSYDHRVIDGADGARFTGRLAALLSDLRRILL